MINLAALIKSTGKYDLTIFSQKAVDKIVASIVEKKDKIYTMRPLHKSE